MKRWCIIFLIISGLIIGEMHSCKKDKNKIIINGTVYDPNTRVYVSNATVIISASTITNGFYNPNYNEVASTTTDGNGKFSFEFNKLVSAGYSFYISKNNYFDNTIDVPDVNIVAGIPYTPTYNLYPVGYLKLHVKNNVPYDTNDYIKYSYTANNPGCAGCCTDVMFKGYGMLYDSTLKCKTYGSQNVIVSWIVHKHGNDIVHGDTIFCTPFDTTTFQILY